jgi:hypothetical protein
MLGSFAREPRRCRKLLPTRLRCPIVRCFRGLESRNLNDLVLIPLCLIRAMGAGALRRKLRYPRGRPRGIPNPRRRVPDLSARPVRVEAPSKLLDRQPHLLRPLAKQLLPPPLTVIDPAERLGIDLMSLHTAEDCRHVLATVLPAIARGEIAPAEGARTAKRVRAQLRHFARQVRARFRALARRARTGHEIRAPLRLRHVDRSAA